MKLRIHPVFRRTLPFLYAALLALLAGSMAAPSAMAQVTAGGVDSTQLQAPPAHRPGGEASLVIPDLSSVDFLGIHGRSLLMGSTTGSLWASDDAGEAWRTVSQTLPPIYALRFG